MNHERTAMLEALMEEAMHPERWEAALAAVELNKGAAGPDGMAASELKDHLAHNGGVDPDKAAGRRLSVRRFKAPGYPEAWQRNPSAGRTPPAKAR